MILRGVEWRMVLGGSALGASVLALCTAVPGAGLPLTYVRLALIALAGATAVVFDEPAAAAVEAVPVPRSRRTAVRLIAVLLPLGIWVSGVLALAVRYPVTPVTPLLTEGVGVLALALAGAAVLRLTGRDDPGEVVASILGGTLLAVLLFGSSPRWAPLFPVVDGWAASTLLWTTLASFGVLVVAAASVDPVIRPLARRRRSGHSAGRRAAAGVRPGAPGSRALVHLSTQRPSHEVEERTTITRPAGRGRRQVLRQRASG